MQGKEENYMYTSDEMFVLSFLGAYLGVVCILALVIAVLSIVANWKIYTKAGRPGWKCLIPVYNVYILFDISSNIRARNSLRLALPYPFSKEVSSIRNI